MAAHQLTPDAVQLLIRRTEPYLSAKDWFPVLQVLEIRKIKQGRSRMLLSDGTQYLPGMLATQLQSLIVENKVLVNTIIRLKCYQVQNLTNGRQDEKSTVAVIIMDVDVLEHAGGVIGQPQPAPTDVPGPSGPGPDAAPQAAGGYGPPPGGAYGAPVQSYGAPAQPVAQPAYGQNPSPYGQPATSAYGQPAPSAYGQPAPQAYGQPAPAAAHGQPAQAAYGQPAGYQANAGTTYNTGNAYGAPAGGGMGQAPGGFNQPGFNQPSYNQPNFNQPASTSPYGAIPARYDQRGGATARNVAPTHFTQIKDVSPYISRWTIKGRVTSKGELKRYNRNGSEGCVFNFDMSDATGEIRIVAFKETAEKFFPKVELGKCFTLSKAAAKHMDAGKRKWNQTGHDCEVYLEMHSEFEEAHDDASTAELPRVHLKLIKIADIEGLEAGAVCDIMGVLESCDDWSTINRRDGTEAKKRGFVLKDDSNRTVEITLWGDKVDNPGTAMFDAVKAGQHPVVCIKSARVGDYNGKTLSTIASSTILLDPEDVDGVPQLRSWYEQGGAMQKPQALSVPGKGGRADRRVTFSTIKDENLGSGGQNVWVKVYGTLMAMRTDPMTYPACWQDYNGRKCQKKLNDADDSGQAYCERCGVSSTPMPRYMLQITISDFTGQLENVSIFGETGDALLGIDAAAAHEIEMASKSGMEGEMSKLISRTLYRPRMFKVKCHEDTYNDEARIKHTLAGCENVDFAAESAGLLAMIDDLQNGRPIAAMQPPPPKPAMAAGGAPAWGGAPGGFGQGAAQGSGGGVQAPSYGAPPPAYGYNQYGGVQNNGGAPVNGGGYGAPVQQGGWNAQQAANQANAFL